LAPPSESFGSDNLGAVNIDGRAVSSTATCDSVTSVSLATGSTGLLGADVGAAVAARVAAGFAPGFAAGLPAGFVVRVGLRTPLAGAFAPDLRWELPPGPGSGTFSTVPTYQG